MAKATTKEKSMTTLAEIHAKIEELKKLEAELLAKEREPLIVQMKGQIATYKITATELGFTKSMGEKVAKASKRTTEEAVVKYRDGDNTWSGGRGRKPNWVAEKLEAGEDIEKYKVA